MASYAVQDHLEIRFRLINGSDIGPKSFPVTTTVATLKETVLSQKGWLQFYRQKIKDLSPSVSFSEIWLAYEKFKLYANFFNY